MISSTTASANPFSNVGVNANLCNVGGTSAKFERVFVSVLITPGDTPPRYKPSNATSHEDVKLISSSASKFTFDSAKYFNLANDINNAAGNPKADFNSSTFSLHLKNTTKDRPRLSGTPFHFSPV